MTNDLAKTYFYPTRINDTWTMRLPSHRALQYIRPEGGGKWELERLAAMHDTIKPSDVVYDIGAEQGDMTALFAQWAPEGALGLGRGLVLGVVVHGQSASDADRPELEFDGRELARQMQREAAGLG